MDTQLLKVYYGQSKSGLQKRKRQIIQLKQEQLIRGNCGNKIENYKDFSENLEKISDKI